jgi:uncharacterized SAM-binding protein YcdF (DUF218 family)
MFPTGLRILLTTWISRKFLVLLALGTGLLSVNPERVEWIAVLGGGGGCRLEKAVELQRQHPGAVLLVVGSGPEVECANGLLAKLGAADPHLLVVEPATTRSCVAALRGLRPDQGILVTHGAHAPRVRLTWLLEGISSVPKIVSASDESVEGELLKTLGYLIRY